MILQALYDYYQRKSVSEKGSIAPEGWICRSVDYALILSEDGECKNIEQRFSIEKNKIISKQEFLPAIGKQAMKHTNSGKDANLLWDNAGFVLGLGGKGAIKVESFIKAISEWFNISDFDDEGLSAVKKFYDNFDSNKNKLLKLIDCLGFTKDFEKRDPVLAFCLQGDIGYIHARKEIKKAFELKGINADLGLPKSNCLITGKINTSIVKNETVIKGVWGGQSSGANIISFNKRSFESYGKIDKGGENAPVSIEASSAYTSALNYLLSSAQRIQVGDASTVFWASKDDALEDAFSSLWGADDNKIDDPDRNTNAVKALYRAVEEHGRNPILSDETRFYILGLAPNAARISIRFWYVGTVLQVSQRIVKHFKLLEIDRKETEHEFLPLWRLLKSIAPLDDVKRISPNLAGDMMHSILEDLHYPSTLLAAVVQRIRAEQSKKDKNTGKLLPNVTYPRAALIKAYLNRLDEMENITVSLNLENMNLGYRLGRLFALLEKIQKEAMPGINTTIRERYYGAASSTPVTVFPTLIKLKNHHLKKISNKGRVINFEKMLSDVMDGIDDENPFPATFKLEDQGRFAVGYYHQYQCMAKGNDVNNCIKGDSK